MEADKGRSKEDNVFEAGLSSGSELRLLHSTVLYGANASGKSNFILALHTLQKFVVESSNWSLGQPISLYEPYSLDSDTSEEPIKLMLAFVGPERVKYCYTLEYGRSEVIREQLDFYPHGSKANLFSRRAGGEEACHRVRLGKSLKDKRIGKTVFPNQLYLSRFGHLQPHQQLTPVFKYFQSMQIWNVTDKVKIGELRYHIAAELSRASETAFQARLSKLIKIADTRIESVYAKKLPNGQVQAFAGHHIYRRGIAEGIREFRLEDESTGTQVLFALGGIILKTLEHGGVIVFDELDNSLHPKLSKFLVRLFQNPATNPFNAQLIFATHDVSLLDQNVFRKDQVWFAEKDEEGATELFSIADVDGVRENVPFDKWYMSGKFGGQPQIKEVDFIFGSQALLNG